MRAYSIYDKVLQRFFFFPSLKNTGIKCYTFGSPACVNEALAGICEDYVVSVVLHDDVIPRISPSSVRELLKELLQERESVMRYWKDDLDAVVVRAKGKSTSIYANYFV